MATTDRLSGFDIGVAVKPACYVASTGNLTLTSTQVVDGVAVGSDERVLVKDQTDATENGIYIAQSSSWLRAKDFDGQRDAIPGTWVYVDRGTLNAATFWVAESSSTATSITIGSSIAFTNITPSLSGVSAFSNDTLLPTTTAGGWRSALGIVEPGESLITSTSTGDARSAIDAQEDVITTRGDLIQGSTAGAAERLALGTKNYLLGSDGSDLAYFGGVETLSSSLTIGSSHHQKLLAITATSTDIVVSFPGSSVVSDNFSVVAKKTDSSLNGVFLDSSDGIDGSTRIELYKQYDAVRIVGNGSQYFIADDRRIAREFRSIIPTTAGTEHDISDIHPHADEIDLRFDRVSLSGTDELSILLGTATGFQSTNYFNVIVQSGAGTASPTTEFRLVLSGVAAAGYSGTVSLRRMDSTAFKWSEHGIIHSSTGATLHDSHGAVILDGTLTQIRIGTNGSNTFDSGSITPIIKFGQ